MYAMQPIVLKIGNVAGYTDFPNGLEPDIFIKESLVNPGILGDSEEPLLKIALDQIIGNVPSSISNNNYKEVKKPNEDFFQQIIIEDKIIE